MRIQIDKECFLEKKPEGYVDAKGRLFSERGALELGDIYKKQKKELSACPFCDSQVGVYERIQVEYMQYFHIDGTPVIRADSSLLKSPKSVARCANCHEELTNLFFKKKVCYENAPSK